MKKLVNLDHNYLKKEKKRTMSKTMQEECKRKYSFFKILLSYGE